MSQKKLAEFFLESPESTNNIIFSFWSPVCISKPHYNTDLEFNIFKIEPIFWLIYVSFSNVLFYCCKCFCETFCRAELM